MRHSFLVHVDAAEDVERVEEYIQNAVQSWGGQFPPDDPLFGLHGCVTVKPVVATGSEEPPQVSRIETLIKALTIECLKVGAKFTVKISGPS